MPPCGLHAYLDRSSAFAFDCHMHHSFDDAPLPLPYLWTTLAYALGAQWIHWFWSHIAGRSTGQELFLLMLFSIMGWPIAVILASKLLVVVFKQTPGIVRVVIAMGLIALGLVLFGIPTPWNLVFTSGITIAAFVHSQREEQDAADLEQL